jgi:hypothetical protein
MFEFTQLAPTSPNSIPSFFLLLAPKSPQFPIFSTHIRFAKPNSQFFSTRTQFAPTQLSILLQLVPMLSPTSLSPNSKLALTLVGSTHNWLPFFSWFSTFIHTRPPYPNHGVLNTNSSQLSQLLFSCHVITTNVHSRISSSIFISNFDPQFYAISMHCSKWRVPSDT